MAMTRQAPTVCNAATVQALSSVKKITFSSVVLRPIERAWFSSKNVTIRSFQMKTMTRNVTAAMIATWTTSSSAMARMLPSTMVWIDTEVGHNDAISRPSANSDGEHQPDHRIFAQPRLLLHEGHAERGEDAGEERADRKRRAEDIGRRHTRHDRMRERVAHQRPALEHQIGREECADAADQRAHPHGLQHVVVAERDDQFGEPLGHFGSSSERSRVLSP